MLKSCAVSSTPYSTYSRGEISTTFDLCLPLPRVSTLALPVATISTARWRFSFRFSASGSGRLSSLAGAACCGTSSTGGAAEAVIGTTAAESSRAAPAPTAQIRGFISSSVERAASGTRRCCVYVSRTCWTPLSTQEETREILRQCCPGHRSGHPTCTEIRAPNRFDRAYRYTAYARPDHGFHPVPSPAVRMTPNRPAAADFSAAPVAPRRAVVALIAPSVSTFTFATAENLPGGLLTLIAPDLGRTTSEVGLLVTAYALVVVVASLPLTRLTRRFPRRWVLAATTAVCAAGSLWSALAVGYADLLAARMLTALGQALFWSIVTPATASLFAPAVRGRMIARLAVGTSLAPLLGVPLGTWAGRQAGWRTAFALSSAVSLLACVTMVVAMPHVDAEQSGTARGTHPSLRRFVMLLLVTVLLVTGGFTMITFVTQFLLETAGFPDRWLSALLLVQGAAGLVGTLLIGQVLDRRPWHTVVVALAALTGALTLL